MDKLGKLRIAKIPDISNPFTVAASLGYFEAQYNPEKYKKDISIVYNDGQSHSDAKAKKFQKTKPDKYSFQIVLDATVPGPSGTKIDVTTQVVLFEATCGEIVGNSHRPPYVLLSWGTFAKAAFLTSASVEYSLFSPEGLPLRATINASFEQYVAPLLSDLFNKFSSPDLTHVRTVKAGDTLPNLCLEIYERQDLYLQVAEVNGIINFRDLKEGTELIFPPLEDEEV